VCQPENEGRSARFLRSIETARRPRARVGRVLGALGLCVAFLAGLTGCETDAWWHDPSVIGYWERTPTKVPILERVSAIEGPDDEFVEVEEIQPEDLTPVVDAYRAGPGDVFELRIWDIPVANQQGLFTLQVDQRGFVNVPSVGSVYVNDLSSDEIREAIRQAATVMIEDPDLEIQFIQRRQLTYSIFGQVASSGQFQITEPDFRLLEAITLAGGMQESVPSVYIIRQVSLSPEEIGVAQPARNGAEDQPQPSGEELIELIEGLTDPEEGPTDGGGFAVMGNGAGRATAGVRQPADEPPPIDLIEESADNGDEPEAGPLPEERRQGAWVFVNGEWVRVQTAVPDPTGLTRPGAERLVTQRVVRIPSQRLLAGDARYNPVVRPGDVIRIPPPQQGNVYMAGEVARPGVYGLPTIGRLTLMRAVVAAGGLTPTAIPERVDLTRRTGPNEQATIRLSLRAIFEGTQPDVFLKPDDQINVGTNFWAFPWAVVRNGFRATYGFAFLLDRNFGNDVFGAPPVNRSF